ncbi:Ig-like domain-containing protein [Micromonospora profundi]|uniref:Ig-like domain-containing protein n=1 Tax=Micromonospora profundi TaxID=1420889 RepID=A0AAJ6HNH3_9ACTN|nr:MULTISPECIES: Ig-like domain-containing protein [Micromonospora]KOX04864.1 erfk/ybis/ycfs/ynhg family protein [Micromonospora sp. NRRL B-16802]NJC12322.1 lipoprotein-anchoring transpeptidase ErfK/SrfK [Micromonospora profundi]WLS44180.1 Ig-like domain-containing protein [Micromonospora profundi]
MTPRRRLTLLAVTIAAAPLVLGGCTADRKPAAESAKEHAPAPELTVTPGDKTRDVPVSAEVGTAVKGGRVTAVRLTDDKGKQVEAEPREDGSGWVPSKPLQPRRTYTAEVTATGDSGATTTRTTTFTTMPKSTKPQITSTLYFVGNRTYGTAMPVTVAFDPAIPKEARADVQRRLFVKTNPPQPGTWSWLEDGSQVYYRAPDFWRPGTTISVRAGLEGLPIGKKLVGDAERTATSKIGRQVSLEIDNATKQMTVLRDGKQIRRIPVSLGKPSTPSSSGKMVIMEKHQRTTFDTRGEPNGGYVVDVDDAQRYTWGGEFIHSAPWSEGDQGNTNVSHGCANVSAAAADWLMGVTQVGDLVTVKGTEVELQPGNGWTAWNVSWDEFVKGSALPVPAGLGPAPAAPAHPGAVAGGSPAPAPSVSGR